MPTKIENISHEIPVLSILVYGKSGTGKTSWAAKSPKPFVFLLEEQGAASVSEFGNDGFIEPCKDFDSFAKSWVEFTTSARRVESKGQALWVSTIEGVDYEYQTLVLDGITELQQMAIDKLTASPSSSFEAEYGLSLVEEEVSEKKSFRLWRMNQRALRKTLNTARSIGCNFVCTALCKDDEDAPLLQGKMISPYIGQFFNGVAKTGVTKDGYALAFKPRNGRPTKTPWMGFPSIVSADCNLGSMLLKRYSGLSTVPHKQGDSADKVIQLNTKQQ